MSYYDKKQDETIVFDAGYVIVYDCYGYSRTILPMKDGDEEVIREMLDQHPQRYVKYCDTPLTDPV